MIMSKEDIIQEGESLFHSDNSDYSNALAQAAEKLGFVAQSYDSPHRKWLRDYFLSDSEGKTLGYRGDERYSIELKYKSNEYFKEHKDNPKLYFQRQSTQALLARKTDITPTENLDIKETKVDIEGGNIFSAVNKDGQSFRIVGFAAIVSTAATLERLGMLDNIEQSLSEEEKLKLAKAIKKYPTSGRGIYLAKKYICQELGIDREQLITIPQWAYHIDCQMGYVGRGKFVLHSFQEALKQQDMVNACFGNELGKEIGEYNVGLMLEHEIDVVEKINKKLQKYGFDVEKCVGSLMLPDFTRTTDEKDSHLLGLSFFNFMNGVSINSNNDEHFLTNKSSETLQPFSDQFANRISERFNVKTEFLEVNPPEQDMDAEENEPLIDESTLVLQHNLSSSGKRSEQQVENIMAHINPTMAFMSTEGGGLRCQTTSHISPVNKKATDTHSSHPHSEEDHINLKANNAELEGLIQELEHEYQANAMAHGKVKIWQNLNDFIQNNFNEISPELLDKALISAVIHRPVGRYSENILDCNAIHVAKTILKSGKVSKNAVNQAIIEATKEHEIDQHTYPDWPITQALAGLGGYNQTLPDDASLLEAINNIIKAENITSNHWQAASFLVSQIADKSKFKEPLTDIENTLMEKLGELKSKGKSSYMLLRINYQLTQLLNIINSITQTNQTGLADSEQNFIDSLIDVDMDEINSEVDSTAEQILGELREELAKLEEQIAATPENAPQQKVLSCQQSIIKSSMVSLINGEITPLQIVVAHLKDNLYDLSRSNSSNNMSKTEELAIKTWNYYVKNDPKLKVENDFVKLKERMQQRLGTSSPSFSSKKREEQEEYRPPTNKI